MNMIVASAAMTASAQPALAEKTPEVVPRGPKGEKRPAIGRPGDRTSGNGQFDCGSRAGWKMSGPARILGRWETRSTDALRH
jgi:hypothetical protein